MARLSQKAWNNVIIFSMLIMITILNMDRFSGDDDLDISSIIEESDIVLSMQIDQNVIERVGQSWRFSPKSPAASSNVDAQKLAILINNWQRAIVAEPIEIIDNSLFNQPRHIAVIWLAGESEGRAYPIIVLNDNAYIQIANEAKLLDFPNLSQLVSW